MTWWQILIIVLVVLIVVFGILYFVGRNLQKKVDSQQGLIESAKQTVSILIIDKKKMRISESNLPAMVQEQIPWYLKWRKMPLVKANRRMEPHCMVKACSHAVPGEPGNPVRPVAGAKQGHIRGIGHQAMMHPGLIAGITFEAKPVPVVIADLFRVDHIIRINLPHINGAYTEEIGAMFLRQAAGQGGAGFLT